MSGAADHREALLRKMLDGLGNLDFGKVGSLLHEGASFETPYAGPPAHGKQAVLDMLSTAMPAFVTHMDFTVHNLYPGADPDVLISEYESTATLIGGGRYANRYINVMRVKDGKILLFREYFNPVAIAEAQAQNSNP